MRHTSRRLDVIVTVGDRRSSRPVLGKNKAFLPVAEVPVILHVLSAVERARCTARIFVVGDKARLEKVLADPHSPVQGTRPLYVIEQHNTLYENVWNTFLHTLPDYTPEVDWRSYLPTEAVDKAVLVLPGDIPLATPHEIEAFVDGCDLTLYDYCIGLTAEAALRAYYPRPGHAGIRMAYFVLRDLQVRQNNLHLVKPLRFRNREYIQQVYECRYQQKWGNILRVVGKLTQQASLRLPGYFLCLHIARFLTKYGWQRLPFARPFFLELPVVLSLLSQLFQTRCTTVITPYGGCALDIDEAAHYAAIRENFTDWMAHQHALAQELKP